MKNKTRFQKLALRLIGAIFILGLSLGLSAFFRFFDYPFLAGQAESISIRYRDAELPWEAIDLSQIHPVKKSENAAPILKQAYAVFDKP